MFYKLTIAAATLLIVAPTMSFAASPRSYANASAGASANASAASQSASRSAAQGGNANSSGNTSNNNNSSTFQDRRQAPGIGIPSLAAGAVTCLGSVSGGFSVAGFGGGLGSTYLERYCESRAAADQIYRYGYRRQAINLLIAEHPMVNRAFANTQPVSAPGYAAKPRRIVKK
jgi:hypothetical protein